MIAYNCTLQRGITSFTVRRLEYLSAYRMRFILIVILCLINYCGISVVAQGNVRLVSFTYSECCTTISTFEQHDQLLSKSYDGKICSITVSTMANCCADIIPQVEMMQDTLSLRYEEVGTFCDCGCCFQFTYHISGITDTNFIVKLQDKIIEYGRIRYTILHGDTINYYDTYNRKQGLHIVGNRLRPFEELEYRNNTQFEKLEYRDDTPWNGSTRIFYYTNGGKSSEITYTNGEKKHVTYFPDGQMESECKDFTIMLGKNFGRSVTLCTTWDSTGRQTATMDCCLFADSSRYTHRLFVFDTTAIYSSKLYMLSKSQFHTLRNLRWKKGDRILVCYKKGLRQDFMTQVLSYLPDKPYITVEVQEFATR